MEKKRKQINSSSKKTFGDILSRPKILPYILLSPTLLLMAVLLGFPWIWSFILSLQNWSPFSQRAPVYIGFDNYISLLMSTKFQISILRTIVFTIINVGLQFIIGFSIALALNSLIRARKWFLTFTLLPMMITPSIVGLIWKVLLHSQWGIINWIIREIGMQAPRWLSNPNLTLVTITIVEVWVRTPFTTLVMLAGLSAIPKDPYEAAEVDGATIFQKFRYITVPWLLKLIIIVLMFRVIYSLRVFDTIYSLFRSGGPGGAGNLLGVYLYDSFRITWELGQASTVAYILLALTMLVGLFFVRKYYKEEK